MSEDFQCLQDLAKTIKKLGQEDSNDPYSVRDNFINVCGLLACTVSNGQHDETRSVDKRKAIGPIMEATRCLQLFPKAVCSNVQCTQVSS